MMNDMTQAMGNVTEQVSRGELPPDRRQQMAERMGPLSMMMRRMSGLAARPAVKEPEWWQNKWARCGSKWLT
jgi:hypothetical protein